MMPPDQHNNQSRKVIPFGKHRSIAVEYPSTKPPHNLEAEQKVLGALLLKNALLPHLSFLHRDHFYEPLHGEIFGVASMMIMEGRHADPVTMKQHFERAEGPDGMLGSTYLAHLVVLAAHCSCTMSQLVDYGHTVQDTAIARQMLLICQDHANAASVLPADFPIQEQLEEMTLRLQSLRDHAFRVGEDDLEFPQDMLIETDVAYVIKGVIPSRSIGFLYGESTAGKTFLAIHGAFCLATGK